MLGKSKTTYFQAIQNVRKTKKNPVNNAFTEFFRGGPEEIRTPDPYNANVMRSQLRYGPVIT